jgi:hypothetical protein
MDFMCSSFTHKWPYNFEASVVVVAAVAIASEEEKETDHKDLTCRSVHTFSGFF